MLVLGDELKPPVRVAGSVENLILLVQFREWPPLRSIRVLQGDVSLAVSAYEQRGELPPAIYTSPTFWGLLKMLERRRVDAVIYTGTALQNYFENERQSVGLFGLPHVFHEKQVTFFLHRHKAMYQDELLDLLRQALATLHENGTIRDINEIDFQQGFVLENTVPKRHLLLRWFWPHCRPCWRSMLFSAKGRPRPAYPQYIC